MLKFTHVLLMHSHCPKGLPKSTDPLGSGVWELMFPLPYPSPLGPKTSVIYGFPPLPALPRTPTRPPRWPNFCVCNASWWPMLPNFCVLDAPVSILEGAKWVREGSGLDFGGPNAPIFKLIRDWWNGRATKSAGL